MTSASTYSESGSSQRPLDSIQATNKANQAQLDIQNLPEKRPPLSDNCWLHGEQPKAGQVWIITSQLALEQIIAHSHSDLSSELGGALLGHAYRHQSTVFVEVKAAIPATNQDHGPIHFTFTADSWPQLQADRNQHYPELDIVGWFHTHPGLGVFYSSDDVVVHSAAFILPWHVGLVFDPIRNEACFFGWVRGELEPFTGFYELVDQGAESVIDWRVVKTAVWDHAYDYSEGLHQDNTAISDDTTSLGAAVAPSMQSRTRIGPTINMWAGLSGIALFSLLLLVVGWVLPLNRQVTALQGVVNSLAGQAILTANDVGCPDPNLRILTPLTGTTISKGDTVPVIGTADIAEAIRYRVEVRPEGQDLWVLVTDRRLDMRFGQLAVWDTEPHEATAYELRLTAVDRNNVILESQSTPCYVLVEVTP